jgi:hypothetical protein
MTEKCTLNLFIRFYDTVKTCEVLDKFSESIVKSKTYIDILIEWE